MATTPNPTLQAIPGESAQAYETRLGSMNKGTTNAPAGTGFGTPIAGFKATPAAGGATAPATPPATPNGVDANGQPLPPPQLTAAQIQAQADALAAAPVAPSTGTRTSASIESDFQKTLDGLGSAPTPPDTNAVQGQEETALGVPALQTGLQTANDTLTKLQAQIQTEQGGEASKPGVVSAIINGRMQMISAESANALAQAKLAVTNATNQLNNANTAVATFMKNTQTDYSNASAAYEKAYTAAVTQYNDEQSQLNKEQTSAKANAQVIINSFKGSSAGINSITSDEQAQWTTLEQQAGLPPGTIMAAITAELNITKIIKGNDGSSYVTGTDANGNPYVAKIEGSQGSAPAPKVTTPPSSGAWNKTQLQSFTNQFGTQLDGLKGTDGAVSNSDYNAAKANWLKLGGTPAAFDSAFKQYKSTNPQKS